MHEYIIVAGIKIYYNKILNAICKMMDYNDNRFDWERKFEKLFVKKIERLHNRCITGEEWVRLYYAMKGVIRDVVQPKVCTLVMDTDGVILNNIKQEWLNSALPKKSGRVMILSGKRKFKSGQMLLRDKKTKRVHVKLDSKDKVKQFSYDEVAEYLG